MHAVVEAPTPQNDEQVLVEQTINSYLHQTLGEAYRAGKGRQMPDGDWRFLVLFHHPDLTRPSTTAIIHVDRQSGRVMPLTKEQCQEAHERALIAYAEAQHRLPLIDGCVPHLFARRMANLYLSDAVGSFLTPVDGMLAALERPTWQFSIQLRLPQSGDLGVLGKIEVNAQTGEVLSLTAKQIIEIQRHANALARYQTRSTAA